jgi:hypothetical protein
MKYFPTNIFELLDIVHDIILTDYYFNLPEDIKQKFREDIEMATDIKSLTAQTIDIIRNAISVLIENKNGDTDKP